MRSFYLTDAGKVRDHNEDSVIIVKNSDNEYLMAIADGMGGHSAGEVASSIAIGYLGKHFKDTLIKEIVSKLFPNILNPYCNYNKRQIPNCQPPLFL